MQVKPGYKWLLTSAQTPGVMLWLLKIVPVAIAVQNGEGRASWGRSIQAHLT